MSTAMVWASALSPATNWVVTVPVDVPFLPHDLVGRLTAAASAAGKDVAIATSGGRVHHTIAAWQPALAERLLSVLETEAVAVHRFQSTLNTIEVAWPVSDRDPFMNINAPDDLALAESILKR